MKSSWCMQNCHTNALQLSSDIRIYSDSIVAHETDKGRSTSQFCGLLCHTPISRWENLYYLSARSKMLHDIAPSSSGPVYMDTRPETL